MWMYSKADNIYLLWKLYYVCINKMISNRIHQTFERDSLKYTKGRRAVLSRVCKWQGWTIVGMQITTWKNSSWCIFCNFVHNQMDCLLKLRREKNSWALWWLMQSISTEHETTNEIRHLGTSTMIRINISFRACAENPARDSVLANMSITMWDLKAVLTWWTKFYTRTLFGHYVYIICDSG